MKPQIAPNLIWIEFFAHFFLFKSDSLATCKGLEHLFSLSICSDSNMGACPGTRRTSSLLGDGTSAHGAGCKRGLKGKRAVDGPVEEQVIDCVSVLQLPLFSPRGVFSACPYSGGWGTR